MTSGELTEPREALRVTLAAGWQVADLEQFLDGSWIDHAPLEQRADPEGAEQLDLITEMMRSAAANAGLCFAAVRRREEVPALDVLTIALPDDAADDPVEEPPEAGVPATEVELDHGVGLMRETSGERVGGGGGSARVAQMTVYLPDADRGAILTLLTWGSVESAEIARDLRRIANSLRVVALPPA